MPIEGVTPGRWKVYRAENGKLLGIGDADAGGITDAYGGLWRSGKEMEANAHLIAAAPWLYEALEGLLAFAEDAETKALVGDEGCLWPVEEARAALAAARGQP